MAHAKQGAPLWCDGGVRRPRRSVGCGATRVRGGISAHGCLFAIPGAWLGGGYRVPPHTPAAAGVTGRHCWRRRGYYLQYWISVSDYPLNIGGRPLHSWPAFIPVTFELIILGAALAAVLGMLALNRLPMPYHPVFNVPAFELATRNRFFLCIEATDPKFDAAETRRFLESLKPHGVFEVQP